MERIVIIQKSTCVQAYIRFRSRQRTLEARSSLQGQCIYDDCCQMDIEFSNYDALLANYNDERHSRSWQVEPYAHDWPKQQRKLIIAGQYILPRYFEQGNNLVNNGKVHDASETVDPSQPISKAYEPSGNVCEVQTADHSSSLVVQTHEIVQTLDEPTFNGVHKHTNEVSHVSFVILTKCFSTVTATIRDVWLMLTDVPTGLGIIHFAMSTKSGLWIDDLAAPNRNKMWYFLVRWLQPI
ncbi:hypothetical protein LWI28_020274 [Acer negundo]|uniref:PTBP1-like RNA recognition motif 2 domain-containing protein n=1 Tax=Acer negundo TaxID=4023 RepID=A0AAD5IF67_ACENE|nr:hypothetical protein LWI28_020274 [Acer negundo]